MKRISIFVVYDKDEVIDRSVEYYVDMLSRTIDRLIIIVIGNLKIEEINKLKRYTLEIYFKQNEGFDMAAYKYALSEVISVDELQEYDELVLSNDTNFGPFIPFEDIFSKMELIECDFWGTCLIDIPLKKHLQSDFRAFRRNTFQHVVDYFQKYVTGRESKYEASTFHEVAFYRNMIVSGYKGAAYIKNSKYDTYYSPYQMLTEFAYPFMKKRGFDKYSENAGNFCLALNYLKEKHTYDISCIYDTVLRKYGIGLDVSSFHGRSIDFGYIEEDVLEQFCNRHEKIYIYGAGMLAKDFYAYYYDLFANIKAFIVSEMQEKYSFMGHKVISIQELTDRNAGIVVCMNYKNSSEVRLLLKEFKNVLYLWKGMSESGEK